jgi:hypothetical protein
MTGDALGCSIADNTSAHPARAKISRDLAHASEKKVIGTLSGNASTLVAAHADRGIMILLLAKFRMKGQATPMTA